MTPGACAADASLVPGPNRAFAARALPQLGCRSYELMTRCVDSPAGRWHTRTALSHGSWPAGNAIFAAATDGPGGALAHENKTFSERPR